MISQTLSQAASEKRTRDDFSISRQLGTSHAGNARRIDGGMTHMRTATRARAKQVLRAKNFLPKTERQLAEEFSGVVVDFSAGTLAQAARKTKDAAKKWKSASVFPNGASLIAMAQDIKPIRDWLFSEIERGRIDEADGSRLTGALVGMMQRLVDQPGQDGDLVRGLLRQIAKDSR